MIFDQIRQGRISDNILAQIKNAIFTGVYKPGDKLPSEKELKEMFKVSRVPLREALRSLEEMGIIKIKSGVLGGAFVADMGIKSVSAPLADMIRLGKIGFDNIWEFRIFVEPSICEMAARRRTNLDIRQIEAIVVSRKEAVKGGRVPIVASLDFHQAVARASKNNLAILIMDAVAEILLEFFKQLQFNLSDHKSIAKAHRKILECIKRKDTQHVGNVMCDHLNDVKKRLKI